MSKVHRRKKLKTTELSIPNWWDDDYDFDYSIQKKIAYQL